MVHACVTVTLVAMMLMSQGVSAKRGCSAFGHSCFGGHGKRSDSSSLEASNPDVGGRRQQLGQEETPGQQVYPNSGYKVLSSGDDIIPIRGGSGYEDAQTREIMKYKLRDLVRHWLNNKISNEFKKKLLSYGTKKLRKGRRKPCLHAANCMNLEITTKDTGITESSTDIPELTREFPELARDISEQTRDIFERTGDMPEIAKDVLGRTWGSEELPKDVLGRTWDKDELSRDVPERTWADSDFTRFMPELTDLEDVPEHTNYVPEETRDFQELRRKNLESRRFISELRKNIPKPTNDFPELTRDVPEDTNYLPKFKTDKTHKPSADIPGLRRGHWLITLTKTRPNIPGLREGHWMESFRRSQQNEDNYVEIM